MENKFQFTTNQHLARRLRQIIGKYETMTNCLRRMALFVVKLDDYGVSLDIAIAHVNDIADCLLGKDGK